MRAKRPNVGGQRSLLASGVSPAEAGGMTEVREGQGFDAPLGLDFLFLIIFVKAVA